MKRCQKMKWMQRTHLGSVERSVTWHGGVVASAEGEATPKRRKGGDDVCWANVNLTGSKNEENPIKVICDTSPGATTRVAHRGLLIGETKSLDAQAG
jgi:hypothetical protein